MAVAEMALTDLGLGEDWGGCSQWAGQARMRGPLLLREGEGEGLGGGAGVSIFIVEE